MIPTIQLWLMQTPAVTALFGTGSAMRFYRDAITPGITAYPRGTFSISGGSPENYMGQVPGIDKGRFEFNVYSDSVAGADAAYKVIRDALETRGHIVSFNGSGQDPVTKSYFVSIDFQFWTNR